jgi:hypothetical protein
MHLLPPPPPRHPPLGGPNLFYIFLSKPPAGHEGDRYLLSITVNGELLGHICCWAFYVSLSLNTSSSVCHHTDTLIT